MSSPVRIAVIDSGVHPSHPHVNSVAGGISITPAGRHEAGYLDRLGHGTAVTAAIREKAPDAAIFAVKIFHDSLAARIEPLLAAIDWSVACGVHFINLSLGTANPAHEPALRDALDRAVAAGIRVVAAYQHEGIRWLPGSLPGAVPVVLDADCPRHEYRMSPLPDGRTLYHASGLPRPIPGVSPERNLQGISFAVAIVTGLLAREAAERSPHLSAP